MTDVRDAPAPTDQQARTGPNPTGDFIWYELMTTDSDGAKAFYDAVVGWSFGEGTPEFQGYRMINTPDGGFAGGVMPINAEMQQHGARPIWLGYLHVDDVDHKVASIEAAGGKALMGPTDIPSVGRIAMVSDPQGAPFYVMKPIPPAGRENEPSTVFSPSNPGRCAWNELSTSDPAAARRFYGEQFGWTSDDFMPMGEHGEYRFIDHHGLRLGAIAGTMQGQQPHWRYYFRVPSVGGAKETAEAKGGKILMGPMEVPGGDHIVIGIDPQGAEFALVGRP
ncbi:MAG TPA: VOC family protein [Sphingomicrobium sp.]|jgi:predicted enzyme related to lactoylglutathione lyase|nr:VOC family protein [Sphingomicrobium sp.]